MGLLELVDRPIAKITAATAVLGGIGSYVFMAANGVTIDPELLAALAGVVGSAATFLFMSEAKKE